MERDRFQLTRLMGGAKLTRFPFFRLEPGCFLKKHKTKTPKKQNALRKHKQTANVFTKQKTNKDKNLNEEWRMKGLQVCILRSFLWSYPSVNCINLWLILLFWVFVVYNFWPEINGIPTWNKWTHSYSVSVCVYVKVGNEKLETFSLYLLWNPWLILIGLSHRERERGRVWKWQSKREWVVSETTWGRSKRCVLVWNSIWAEMNL